MSVLTEASIVMMLNELYVCKSCVKKWKSRKV